MQRIFQQKKLKFGFLFGASDFMVDISLDIVSYLALHIVMLKRPSAKLVTELSKNGLSALRNIHLFFQKRFLIFKEDLLSFKKCFI